MQQSYYKGYSWKDNGHIFLHQVLQVLMNAIETVAEEQHLQPVHNTEIPACCIVTRPTKKTVHMPDTPCIYKAQITKL